MRRSTYLKVLYYQSWFGNVIPNYFLRLRTLEQNFACTFVSVIKTKNNDWQQNN